MMTDRYPNLSNIMTVAAVLVTTSIAYPAFGQDAGLSEDEAFSDGILTFDEAFALARGNSRTLDAAQSLADAAKEDEGVALAGFLPTLAFDMSYSRMTGNFSARPGQANADFNAAPELSNESYNYFGLGLSLQQPVWDFGRTLNALKSSRSVTAAARHAMAGRVADLWLEIFTACSQIASSQEQLDLATSTTEEFRKNADTALELYRIGNIPRIEAVRAETEAQLARVSFVEAGERIKSMKRALLTRIGVEGDRTFKVVFDRSETYAATPEFNVLLDRALAKRPDRQAARERIMAQQYGVRQIRSGHLPELVATAGFSYAGSYIEQLAWNWQVGAGLKIPLFSGLSVYRQTNSAKARLRAAESELEQIDLEIRGQIETLFMTLERVRTMMEPLKAAMKSAMEGVELAEDRFRSGAGSQMEILDTQRALAQTRSQMAAAEHELSVAWAALMKAAGELPVAGRNQ